MPQSPWYLGIGQISPDDSAMPAHDLHHYSVWIGVRMVFIFVFVFLLTSMCTS